MKAGYPPRKVMLSLIALIECSIWEAKDDKLWVGEPGLLVTVVPNEDIQALTEWGYAEFSAEATLTITEQGVEWARKWCKARLGRGLSPNTRGQHGTESQQ